MQRSCFFVAARAFFVAVAAGKSLFFALRSKVSCPRFRARLGLVVCKKKK